MATWSEEALERLRSPLLEALSDEPGVWVVGGAVRDALLGREPRELDLVVEGDAVAVARRTARGAPSPGPSGTSRQACCGSCTPARSSTTPRGCCAWPATPAGWGSR